MVGRRGGTPMSLFTTLAVLGTAALIAFIAIGYWSLPR